ncbi:TonB-dependent receptor [Hyphomonas sp.]|uniref:TonB-dependent receptor n=1 Tax=Hyphomonas sp. TaxID=87 RepID=UPI0025C61FAC|nr:TonB-dependent receptor [Hyphomonas sp.]MBI1401026.1 TonB-dependent receptor plug domain-containing protein [Hyphomonas sp.]
MNNRAMLLCSASLIGALSFAPALAQEADDESGAKRLGTVTVTAQKREESILDVPLSVQAIESETLENAGIKDVAGLVKLIPGASVVSASSRGFETIQIRGISAGTTGDGLTGYYVDDFAFGVPNLQLSPPARLLDLDQVEVIRGPSGTIWGQGSMGGNIRLITADPDTDAFSGKLVGEYSNTEGGSDNYAVDGVVNIPIAKDKFAIRLSGGYDELGGYADVLQTGQTDANGSNGSNFRIKALYTPTDRLSVRATYWTIDNEQGFSNSVITTNPATGLPLSEPALNGAGSVTNGPVDGFVDTSMDIGSVAIKYDFDKVTLTSSTSYTEHELDFEAPLTLGAFNYNNDSTFKTDSFTQEFRLTNTNEAVFNWIAGVYYRDATINSDIDFYLDGTDFALGLIPLISITGPLETKSWSVFGEASWKLFDGKLVPLIGVRYFEDERSSGPGFDRVTSLPRPKLSETFDSVSPRFSLKYLPNANTTIYLNAAHGFRSGTIQTDAQVAAANTLGVPAQRGVDPDELWTYELGGKFSLANGTVLIDGALYRTDWTDVQQPFGPLSSVANVGDAKIEGIDIGLAWLTPVDGLSLQANANMQNAEWDTVRPNVTASLPFVTPGAEVLAVPEQTFSLAANYERDVSVFGGSVLSLNSTYAYRSDSLQQTGTRTDDIKDLSLSANLKTASGVTLGVFAFNALDEDGAAQRIIYAGDPIVRPYPRRIGVKLGVEF